MGAVVWFGGISIATLTYPHHYAFAAVMMYLGSAYFLAARRGPHAARPPAAPAAAHEVATAGTPTAAAPDTPATQPERSAAGADTR